MFQELFSIPTAQKQNQTMRRRFELLRPKTYDIKQIRVIPINHSGTAPSMSDD